MAQVLQPIKDIFDPADTPDLLAGLESPDDAALWQIDDERALVITTDFFTPVVDTPYEYGAIAAANSLSDIYAMGARPFLALNIAAVPPDLPIEITREIIRGGAEKAKEAGVVIAGGHTVQDEEPKYGLVVVGMVDPKIALTKAGARAGDQLVLTKPLGMGVTTTAIKEGLADDLAIAAAISWMSQLNDTAGKLAVDFGLRGATDITGFGLLGHGFEMAEASGVRLRLHQEKIPIMPEALPFAKSWTFPGGSSDNRLHFGPHVEIDSGVSDLDAMLLFDAQTSGGLLLSIPSGKFADFMDAAEGLEQPAWHIGDVVAGTDIEVLP